MRSNRKFAIKCRVPRPPRHLLGFAAVVVAGFAAACSSNAADTTAHTSGSSIINIGEIEGLTGPTAHLGGVDGIKAAIAAVNKAGGINGHPLKLIVCDTQGNPNVATECANQMVSGHVLYVQNDSGEGDSFMPVLRSAGIPVTTGGGVGSDAFTFPNSYILGSGNIPAAGGAGALCAKLGSTKIGIAELDVAGLAPLVDPIYKTITPFGLSKANTSITLIPPTAVDMSTYAAALIQKSTCIIEVLAPNQLVPLAAAIHSQDPSIPIVAPGAATAVEWHTIGKLADNVCDNAPFPTPGLTAAPGMSQYNAEMNTYNKSGLRNPHSISAWSSVHLAAKLLAHVSQPSAATYMQLLNTVGMINLPPLPPLNFGHPTSIIPGITRLMSEDVVYYHHINGGQDAPFYGGKYIDVMSLKSQPPIPTAPRC